MLRALTARLSTRPSIREGWLFVVACAAAAMAASATLWWCAGRLPGPVSRSLDIDGGWYSRSPAWFQTSGIYPTEYTPDLKPFAWTSGSARFRIMSLDRRQPYVLTIQARTGRAGPVSVRTSVDGVVSGVVEVRQESGDVTVAVPTSRRENLAVSLGIDDVLVPGPQDPRPLGVVIERLTLAGQSGRVPVLWRVYFQVALFAVVTTTALMVAGVPILLAGGLGGAGGASAAWLVAFDAAFLSDYPGLLLVLAVWALGATAALAMLSGAVRPALRAGFRVACGSAVLVATLKVLLFLHADAPIGDGVFHVHRAQDVRGGRYLLTSVTPRPFYEFPYPVGLYVAAQPLWEHVPNRVILLRGLAIAADTTVAIVLFLAVAARWGQGAALLASAFSLSLPVVLQTVATANLTNAFAQSLFSLAALTLTYQLQRARAWIAWSLATLLLTAAWLSHFSTTVVGVVAVAAMAAALSAARSPLEKRAWRNVALAGLVSAIAAYLLYYSRYHEVYRHTLAQMRVQAPATSMVATLGQHSDSKLMTVVRFVASNFGFAALAASALGLVVLLWRDWRDGFTLLLAGFGIAVIAFLALGALTPIEMRASLAAHPLVAAMAAAGVSWAWQSGRLFWRVCAGALVVGIAWSGLAAAHAVLGHAPL